MSKDLTLYHGDCLSVLPGLDARFDAVVTDPPYSSGGLHASSRKNSTGDKYLNTSGRKSAFPDFLGDSKDQRSYLHWSILWMGECFKKMEEGGLILVFSDWRQLPVTSDAMQAAGFIWRGVIVWDKTEGVRPYKGGFRSQAEYILWGTKGKVVGNVFAPGVFRFNSQAHDKQHQAGKPVALMSELLGVCGQRILDPFMGSASTGVAALKMGKSFTGIELSEGYFNVAKERLSSAKNCAK